MSLTMLLTRTGLGYVFSVSNGPDEVVRFEVSQLANTQWGIRGRVTVRSQLTSARTVPGMSNYVTTETMDFLSGKSRQWFSDRLTTLIPPPPGGAAIDWSLIVEQLVAQVMDQEHRQPVLVDLATTTATLSTPHLWPYVVPEGKATILYGAGGTGKSAFACAIAAAVQSGRSLLGNKTQQRNVLYCDWETDEGDVAHRVAAASRGIGLTSPAAVAYMSLEMPIDNEIDFIAQSVAEQDIGLVIIDSTMMAMTPSGSGADPASAAIQFFRALRLLGCAAIVIDHISGDDQRRGRAGASKPYGSIAKWNTARNAFELIDTTEAMDGSRVILRHRKANLGPKMPGGEVQIKVEWDSVTDTVTFRRLALSAPAVTLPERVADALETGPASYRVLLDILNSDQTYDMVGEAEVRGASRALLSGGIATIDHQGVLRLTKGQGSVTPEDEEGGSIPLALDTESDLDS